MTFLSPNSILCRLSLDAVTREMRCRLGGVCGRMDMTLSMGIDREKRDPLGRLQERHGIMDGTCRFAAAVPRHEDMPADIVERAACGHH